MTDFIIVGGGLAGMAFAEVALQNGQRVVVYDGKKKSASRVASGLYNPVVLKRLTAVSEANEFLAEMHPFYVGLQDRLGASFYQPMQLLRKFADIEEQNNWFVACEKPLLSPLLSSQLVHKQFPGVSAPFGFGSVNDSGVVKTNELLDSFWQNLPEGSSYLQSDFSHSKLSIHSDHIEYDGIRARHIIFAEGFSLESNPLFNHLPLQGTKGELLYIEAEGIQLDAVINSGIFLLPMGDNIFKVGATYAWDDKTEIPTESAKAELLEKLEKLITVPYEVIDHLAGIRPTVSDRKPLLGTHSDYSTVHVLNGLGTRGILLAPRLARLLWESIEDGKQLPLQFDIRRFQ